jgi:hypothetical protein
MPSVRSGLGITAIDCAGPAWREFVKVPLLVVDLQNESEIGEINERAVSL